MLPELVAEALHQICTSIYSRSEIFYKNYRNTVKVEPLTIVSKPSSLNVLGSFGCTSVWPTASAVR